MDERASLRQHQEALQCPRWFVCSSLISCLHHISANVHSWTDSYTVLAKRGSFPLDRQNPVNLQSKKLFDLLSAAYAKKQPVQTMGALDPVQMSQMAAAGLQVAYVSGWAASSLFLSVFATSAYRY